MTIVIWTILECSYPALELIEDVNTRWPFASSIVDHDIGTRFAILTSKYKLFRYHFLVLLVDVSDSVRPLKPRENGKVNSVDKVSAGVKWQLSQANVCNNSTCFVKYDDLRVIFIRRHEHLGEELNVLNLLGHTQNSFLCCVTEVDWEATRLNKVLRDVDAELSTVYHSPIVLHRKEVFQTMDHQVLLRFGR